MITFVLNTSHLSKQHDSINEVILKRSPHLCTLTLAYKASQLIMKLLNVTYISIQLAIIHKPSDIIEEEP